MDEIVVMCDASSHIKDLWDPKEGDRYYIKNNLYAGKNSWTTIKPIKQPISIGYVEGYDYVDEGTFGIYFYYEDPDWYDEEGLINHSVWVPYQHQIQEMLMENFYTIDEMFSAFTKFIYRRDFGSPIKWHTMEELWIMFFHYHLFSEFWDGRDWNKVEEMRSFWGG